MAVAGTAQERARAEDAFEESVGGAEAALAGLDEQIAASEPVIEYITADKFDDAGKQEAASAALERAREISGREADAETEHRSTDELEQAAEQNSRLASEADEAATALKAASDALAEGYTAQLQERLTDALDKAQSVYESSDGWADGEVREALKSAIEAASAEGMGYKDMEAALSELRTRHPRRSSRKKTHGRQPPQRPRRQAARPQAEHPAARRLRTHGTLATSGAGQAEIDTGAVVQWKSGYFCAHNWSSGGVMIASKPSYVVVDGVTYRYVSSINVARDTTWGEVSGFALANGGIAFQTCSGDTYLITHYEPV